MSRPCHTTQGPKPPVASKPSLVAEACQSIVGNGDVTSSDRPELKQENESDISKDEASAYREEDHSKTIDDINSPKNGEDANENLNACFKNETHTEDQTAGESAESRDPQNLYSEIEEPLSDSFEDTDIDPTYLCEEHTRAGVKCVHHEADEDVACNKTGLFSKDVIDDNNLYDVIDDNNTCQAERATKDPSGRFSFAKESVDPFEPYSVIEVVPSDLKCISNPEERCSEDGSSNENPMNSQITAEATSNQEPYYVSSDDVAELEEQQAKLENSITSPTTACESKEIEKDEAVDDYADIEDQDIEDQVECVSSEDYVEIGEDEPVNISKTKEKSVREWSSKRGHALLSQRDSCQPRLRLCSITVPADLDPGQAPKLTNRVVFAHTTEAFEEDIEEQDCHIVPFFEDSDTDSDEHIYEEAGFDSEGENFIPLDMKNIVTRSGKIPGYVPETVSEEMGTEFQTHDYYTVTLDQNGDPHPKPSDPAQANQISTSLKPRCFLLPPRLFSVEDRDLSFSGHFEGEKSSKKESSLQRKGDTLSLPCVITSSGSFSQSNHQSCSGVPTSLVDIPPPFDLSYITKRPVTKSSPSLLIQHESPDNQKKKISFKHLLTLKFRKKTENKASEDGSVRSSRSSSESSHHGSIRALEHNRKSNRNSPQLQSHVAKPQNNSDLSTNIVPHKKRQRRYGAAESYGSRVVPRGESFEERSRPPFMPLPLTKPRSISFPSADTSDYENIPEMSSDYDNIQIPHGRPNRAFTVTGFFDEQNWTSSAPINENDGYVDMNGFAGIENKTTPQKQENESAYTEPFPVCPTPVTVSHEDDHGHTSEEDDGCGDHDRQVVCRSCSCNRYTLKNRVDKVCEHTELRKRDGNISGNTGPHTHRARPLSAVFQNLQPQSLWRNRKSSSPHTQVSVSCEGSTMSGSLQRRKKSKKKWKRLWFLLKDKVLYTFKAREDEEASESLPLQGFTVKMPDPSERDTDCVFHLYHKTTLYYSFRADDQHTALRWVNAMEEASVITSASRLNEV